jgi:flagellar hook-associated protein 2
LGIAQSVADSTLTGSTVYQISSDVSLASINDGNGLRLRSGSTADLSITLSDGTNLQVDLDGSKTVGDVIKKINNATSNGGKLTAALTNGRLELTDNSGGTGTLSVDGLAGSNAQQVLGLDNAASGNVLTGKALTGGLDSVLLRNLRGGQGITTPGSITLTDRTGATATVDLSQAESLDDVLSAINNAATSGNVKLQLHAAIDANGTGVTVTDTSGQSASNLVIGDVDNGTVAHDLNIAVNSAQNSVSSGSLRLRSVNDGTLLNHYSPSGGAVSLGSFSITDAAGESAVVTLGSSAQTIGDVIDRINAAGINVSAQLNDTGDGFVLVDNSTGTGTLRVQDIGGATASDLHLLGGSVTGTDGKQRITSRDAAVIKITADDTLTSISTKINSAGGQVKSSVIDSGSAINPFRLSLSASASGSANRLVIDDGGLGFNFSKQVVGQDAVLRIGSDPASAFLKTSSTNQFNNAITGYNVTLLQPSDTPAIVSTSLDSSSVSAALSTFVKNYNQMATQIDSLTSYDSSTQTRGPLQGDIGVLQVEWNVTSLINQVTGAPNSPIRSLADIGLVVGASGQLSFDPSVFQQAITDHPQEVTALLTDSKSGFGMKLNSLLTDLNDPNNGSITLEAKADADHIQSLQDQIDRMNDSMANKQAFLENQFANMETLISGLQSQQDALTALASIAGTSTAASSSKSSS